MGNQMSEEQAREYIRTVINRSGEEEEEFDNSDEEYQNENEGTEPQTVADLNGTEQKNLSELRHRILLHSGHSPDKPDQNLFSSLRQREVSSISWNSGRRAHASQRYLPSNRAGSLLTNFRRRGFCGQYSRDGRYFLTGSEGRGVLLFDADTWKPIKEISAELEIRDMDYSPDQRWLVYSGWSASINLCNVIGEHEVHDSLNVMGGETTGPWGYFCLFSVKFSPSSDEVACGSNDNSLYIYDLNRRELALRVEGHDNDINTVCYLGSDHNMILTGSDDCLVKLWDRRILGRSNEPVGVFPGHVAGITHVSSKGDGRYFISNGKDQCIKLWDIREMKSPQSSQKFARPSYDYRRGAMNPAKRNHPNDCSLMTYASHVIGQTLIRCYFSPLETTGQRYITTGSADSNIYVYDVLTGEVVRKLHGHGALVRDVSWHPYDMKLVSTSWDTTLGMWSGDQDRQFFPKEFVPHRTTGWWS